MKQIQEKVLKKLALMTEWGILKWQKRPSDELRWIKSSKIKIAISMNSDIECLLADLNNCPMIIKGGLPILREAIKDVEWEFK